MYTLNIFALSFIISLLVILYVIYYLLKKFYNPLKESVASREYCIANKEECEIKHTENMRIPEEHELIDFSYYTSEYCINKIIQIFNDVKDDEFSTINMIRNRDTSYRKKLLLPRIFGSNSSWLSHTKPFTKLYKIPGGILVANRGTYSPEEMLANMNYSQRNFMSGKIHNGFYEIYNNIRVELLAKIKQEVDEGAQRIILTGHSMGAAVSVLCACELKEKYPTLQLTCYTFGMPRIGNKEFVLYVDDNIKLYQFINDSDQVPMFPFPSSPNFVFNKLPFMYDCITNGIIRFQKNKGSMMLNHFIMTYKEHLVGKRSKKFRQHFDY